MPAATTELGWARCTISPTQSTESQMVICDYDYALEKGLKMITARTISSLAGSSRSAFEHIATTILLDVRSLAGFQLSPNLVDFHGLDWRSSTTTMATNTLSPSHGLCTRILLTLVLHRLWARWVLTALTHHCTTITRTVSRNWWLHLCWSTNQETTICTKVLHPWNSIMARSSKWSHSISSELVSKRANFW